MSKIMDKNYYEILGVAKDATHEDIRSTYRKLAKQYHPDLNPNNKEAEDKFKEVNEAYEILADPNKKQIYDNGGSDFSNGINIDDFMSANDFFGMHTRNRHSNGENLVYNLSLKLEELVESKLAKDIDIEQIKLCKECNGKRVKKEFKDKDTNCPKCKGQGKVTNVMKRANFIIKNIVPCPDCQGSGKIIKDEYKCTYCNGNGVETTKKTVNIKIPNGISNGSVLRIPNEGHCSLDGGRNGDLFVAIQIEQHPIFTMVNENDLYMILPISFSEAVLGNKIEIPTISGKNISLEIPKGTQNGTRIIKEGCGLPSMYDKGSLIIDINVIVPSELSNEDEKLFKKMLNNKFDDRKEIDNYLRKKENVK